ncbi:MAG: hypothetical protein ACXWVD_14570, partial [Telluria sp.]
HATVRPGAKLRNDFAIPRSRVAQPRVAGLMMEMLGFLPGAIAAVAMAVRIVMFFRFEYKTGSKKPA